MVYLSPRVYGGGGIFVDNVFLHACYLASILQHVSHLAMGAGHNPVRNFNALSKAAKKYFSSFYTLSAIGCKVKSPHCEM